MAGDHSRFPSSPTGARDNETKRHDKAAGNQQARRHLLRTLLIHGARSVLMHAKQPGAWMEELGKRRPSNVVVVALANKMARTIWAMLAHDRAYQGDWVSIKPA